MGQKFDHMKQLESFFPFIRLHEKEIEKRFGKLTHTPDHPPYASMIQKAISELNEQGGSSEEAISNFIMAQYDDLPIAHTSYLSHHLQKLITKEEIVCTSANCYILSSENSDSLHKLKKRQKRVGKLRQRRQWNAKEGARSQQKQMIEESQEHNQECEKISEGGEEEKQAEEQKIGSLRETKEQGNAILNEELDEVEEVQYKVIEELIESEQSKEAKDHDLMQEQQNQQQMELNIQESQVLWQTMEGTAEEQNQEEDGYQARKNDVIETELQAVREDVVTEEPHHKEQESGKPVENNLIQDQESEVREQEVQLADIPIETMVEHINPQGQCFELSYEEKKLQEQEREVCCQIIISIKGTAEEQNQEEEGHQAGKNDVIETELQAVRGDVVTEELHHKEQESGKPVENNLIQDQESGVREQEVQLADIPIETMVEHINLQGQCFELSYEEKKLQEQEREVCCQIMDLSNMLVQFVTKEKEDEATVSTQNDTTNQKDLFGSSHLTKEELMELLKKTHKIEGKLIDIISSLNMDTLERNNSNPATERQQKKLSEDHLQQTKKPCLKESESLLVRDCQPQQQEICGQLEVSEAQPKTILASDNVPTGLMAFEQNCQIELPIHKRPPEVEITILEGLNREQNKQVKLCDQQEAFNSPPKSMASSLDVSSNSLHDENENSEVVVERIEMVLEETGTSFADVQFMDSEKLQNSNHCGSEKVPESRLVTSSLNVAIELQAVDLEKQVELQKTKTLPAETKLSITDKATATALQIPMDSMQQPHLPVPEISAEQEASEAYVFINSEDTVHLPIPEISAEQEASEAYVFINSEDTVHEHQADLTASDTSLNPNLQFPGPQRSPELTVQVEELSTDHQPQLTTATYITKQLRQTKKMPDQQQLRKLRARGPRPSKNEPVLTTAEADNDLTLASLKAELKQNPSIHRRPQEQGSQTEFKISQSAEQEPSIRKRKQNGRHKAVVKISQPTEQQVNHQGQPKRLKSQPTITTVDLAITSQLQTQEQEQEQLQHRKLQGQPPSQSESVVGKSTEESSPLRNQPSEQVEPQIRRRGRPPKEKPTRELSALDHQHHVQRQSPCPTRGRQSKKKTNGDAAMKGSLFSDHQNRERQQ